MARTLIGLLAAALALVVLGATVANGRQAPAPPPGATPPLTPTPTAAPPPLSPSFDPARPQTDTPVAWRRSRAVGKPFAGRLVRGVELPAGGRDYFTWDSVLKRSPSRAWRRWGTDRLLRTVLQVLAGYHAAHPDAPRVGIGDLSRPGGGVFDERYGGLGHSSHQNGLDVDLYYPRADRRERRPYAVSQVDRVLAQALVDAFVAAGAQYVFVGPRTGLRGPGKIVQPLGHHDDHLHVRIR